MVAKDAYSAMLCLLLRIIATLEKLKEEAAEITRKVEETDVVMAEVEAVSDQYGALSHYCSSIYFTMEGLNLVSNAVEPGAKPSSSQRWTRTIKNIPKTKEKSKELPRAPKNASDQDQICFSFVCDWSKDKERLRGLLSRITCRKGIKIETV